MDKINEEILCFMKELALDVGKLIKHKRTEGALQQDFKQGIELVTNVDVLADETIRSAIMKSYPGHRILSEELAPELATLTDSAAPLWIIDPIDGTVNYAHGHYQVAISLAFVENSDIQCAVVYNPFLDELFSARNRAGAELNGNPIQVAGQSDLRKSIIATGFPYTKDDMTPLIRRVARILDSCADIRRLGSAALDICWVACGRLDGYYENLRVWDFAAAQLIAREAGARYGHFQPVPEGVLPVFHDQNILVANSSLYPKLATLLQEADKEE